MSGMRIVFMGTPEFAVPSLQILLNNKKNVVGVITAEDKPQGRGQKMSMSPVKELALQHGLKVLQPSKLKVPDFIEELRSLRADLQVVVAFRMLPEMVWSMPPKGTFNLHASLLPQYRGAAPINWAIINGEQITGVTTFFLQQEIDTGAIIFQESEPISAEDDAGTLYNRLMNKGAELVLKTVNAIENDTVETTAQLINGRLKTAPKIFKETCQIDWNKTGSEIRNFVRGLSPYPGAWTQIATRQAKVFNVNVLEGGRSMTPGKLETDQKSFIYIGCKDSTISVNEFQLEGKRRMRVDEFFRGNKIETAQ
jgi:methionyl-tRNA formyltransferase